MTTCRTNLVHANYAEEYVLNEIEKWVNSPEIVNSIVKKLKKNNEVDTKPMMKELQKIKKELENIQAKKEQNLLLELENKFNISILTQKNGVLGITRKKLRKNYLDLKVKIHNIES